MGTILVTGASGFMGARVCARLVTRADVLAIARSKDRLVTLERGLGGRLRGTPCDLANETVDATLASALSEVTHAVHMASPVPGPGEKPSGLFDEGQRIGSGTLGLLHHAPNLRYVCLLSSVTVYDLSAPMPLDEGAPLCAEPDPYARHKQEEEARFRAASTTHGWRLCVLRPTQVYGPGEPHGLSLTRILQTAAAGRPVVLENAGDDERDLVYVDDVARAVQIAIDRELIGAFNVSSGKALSIRDMAAAVTDGLARPVVIEKRPRVRPPTRLVFANTKLKNATGFVPETPLTVGVAACVAALRRDGA